MVNDYFMVMFEDSCRTRTKKILIFVWMYACKEMRGIIRWGKKQKWNNNKKQQSTPTAQPLSVLLEVVATYFTRTACPVFAFLPFLVCALAGNLHFLFGSVFRALQYCVLSHTINTFIVYVAKCCELKTTIYFFIIYVHNFPGVYAFLCLPKTNNAILQKG